MKLLLIVAFFVAWANASKLSSIFEKLVPSFPTPFIINSHDAVPYSAPYIVSLSINATPHDHWCAGTIINKEWILTAANCVHNPVGMGVIAGLYKLSEVDYRTQSREVDFGKNHELYAGGVGPYDISLLHVSKPFEYNKWVQPAVLPYRGEINSGKAYLYGWGTNQNTVNFTLSNTLQTVEADIVEFSECLKRLPKDEPLRETNICSDTRQKNISTCSGDSGGPYVIKRKGVPAELIGIVSWTWYPCGEDNHPSVQTRVSAYITWMTKIQAEYYNSNLNATILSKGIK